MNVSRRTLFAAIAAAFSWRPARAVAARVNSSAPAIVHSGEYVIPAHLVPSADNLVARNTFHPNCRCAVHVNGVVDSDQLARQISEMVKRFTPSIKV